MVREIVSSFVVAAVVSAALTPAVRAVARRRGWLARPRADRWHGRDVALMGGVAIFIAMATSAGLTGAYRSGAGIIVGLGGAMFVAGLWDDLWPIGPATKLVVQLSVALVLAFVVPVPGLSGLPAVDLILTVLWVVGITNAINLLDNMDGLAAGIALIAAVYVVLLGSAGGVTSHTIVVAALAGALAGFLPYNVHPASVFMGDSGSLFVGFLLAASVAVAGAGHGDHSRAAILVPLILLAVPILDTALVTAVRLLSGRRVSTGGRDHVSHRLVAMGLSEPVAVALLYVLAGAAGGVAMLVQLSSASAGAIVLALFATLLLIFGVQIARVGVYQEGQFGRLAGQPFTSLLITLAFQRRIFEVLLDVVLVWISYAAAFRLRFDGPQFDQFYPPFLRAMPVVMVCKLAGLWAAGAYGGVWRYLTTVDSFNYIKGVVFGSALSLLAMLYLYRFEGFSRGVFILDAIILLGLLLGTRFSFRLLTESAGRRRADGTPVLVYGAGAGGAIPLRELVSNPEHGVRPVGLIDDDPAMRRQRILGLSVLGGVDSLGDMLARTGAQQVIVADNSIRADTLERLLRACAARGVSVRRIRFVIDQP